MSTVASNPKKFVCKIGLHAHKVVRSDKRYLNWNECLMRCKHCGDEYIEEFTLFEVR